jgi:hypothetical protein
MNHQRLQTQREALAGKIVIGIDPAKDKHQAAVVDAHGNQRGASFSFPVSATGYGETLWRNMAKVAPNCNVQNVVFAIETACNLWETLAFLSPRPGLRRRTRLARWIVYKMTEETCLPAGRPPSVCPKSASSICGDNSSAGSMSRMLLPLYRNSCSSSSPWKNISTRTPNEPKQLRRCTSWKNTTTH